MSTSKPLKDKILSYATLSDALRSINRGTREELSWEDAAGKALLFRVMKAMWLIMSFSCPVPSQGAPMPSQHAA